MCGTNAWGHSLYSKVGSGDARRVKGKNRSPSESGSTMALARGRGRDKESKKRGEGKKHRWVRRRSHADQGGGDVRARGAVDKDVLVGREKERVESQGGGCISDSNIEGLWAQGVRRRAEEKEDDYGLENRQRGSGREE